ncbi:MAG: FlgD immunoglobulin-like domain containing protein, partial [Candidatus Eisenbacteria bacterium]
FQPISNHRVWSGVIFNTSIYFNPDPFCYIDNFSLGGIGPTIGSLDSVKVNVTTITQGYRFGGTNLGNTEGTYWDNIRVGLVRGGDLPALSGTLWNQFQTQFPANGSTVAPGDNATFDTTAAYMNTGLNIVNSAPDPGVVAGDSMVVESPFTGDGLTTGVRLDLVFRIDPGPGNYVIKGNRASGLVNRDPAHPFFQQYLANNGPFGTPGGHGGTWNRHVWNSARFDSAEGNVYPITSRGIGNPLSPLWMSTLHEADPNFNTLGISKNVCFLVDPAGNADAANIDCDGIPPAPYGAVSGTTKEGTKILPDGWMTPGTHLQYFVRRSTIEAPGTFATLWDTTTVFPQDPADLFDLDADRWHSMSVLPDMWKSTRYGGAGLACMLIVDGNDRRGAERGIMGAADSLGYGKNNGAKKGWKGLGPGSDPNDPAGFVAANNGQAGLNFDWYEIRASESKEAGHPGVRLANNLGAIANRGDKSGPSPDMLANLYSTVLHASGDLADGTLHDAFDLQEGANDILLYDNWVTGATAANRRGLWLAGDGIMEDGSLVSDDGTKLLPFLNSRFGASLVSENYKAYSGSNATTVGFLPLAPWAHPGRTYGFNHLCTVLADVLAVEPTVDGAAAAAQYQALGGGTVFTSSVYRPIGASREYRTLFDGFDLNNLRGNYANLAQIATLPGTDIGRISWFDDAVTSHFLICARRGPVVSTDIPGIDGARFANMNLGAMPNPAFAAKNVTLRFTIAKPQNVTVRIFNVAGREVASISKNVLEAGPVNMLWDGKMTTGAKASAGVYFYRVDGIEFGQGSAPSKMILLSSTQ